MPDGCGIELRGDGTLRLTGALTFETVPFLYREMERQLPQSGPLTRIELDGVSDADSAGLALLLEWQARQHRKGAELAVLNAPEGLVKLARLCDATGLLRLSGRAGQA